MAKGTEDSARTDEGVADSELVKDIFPDGQEPDGEEELDEILAEAEDEPDGEDTPTESAEPAAPEADKSKKDEPKLPWDSARQRRDQELANVRKSLAKLDESNAMLQAEILALRRGEKPPERLEDAVVALEALPVPDEFADESEFTEYKTKLARLTARVRALAKTPAPVENPKPKAEPEPEKPPTTGPKTCTQKDFVAIQVEADKAFGAKYRYDASASTVTELKKRGYGPEKPATQELVQDLLWRFYATAKATDGGKAKPAPESEPKKPETTSDDGMTDEELTIGKTGRIGFKTVHQIAQDMKAKLRRK